MNSNYIPIISILQTSTILQNLPQAVNMIAIRILSLEEKVSSLKVKGEAMQAVGGESETTLADHFITSRPLEDQQELEEFCLQLENFTFLDSLVGGLHLVCIESLSGSLQFEAQYLLVGMRLSLLLQADHMSA